MKSVWITASVWSQPVWWWSPEDEPFGFLLEDVLEHVDCVNLASRCSFSSFMSFKIFQRHPAEIYITGPQRMNCSDSNDLFLPVWPILTNTLTCKEMNFNNKMFILSRGWTVLDSTGAFKPHALLGCHTINISFWGESFQEMWRCRFRLPRDWFPGAAGHIWVGKVSNICLYWAASRWECDQ